MMILPRGREGGPWRVISRLVMDKLKKNHIRRPNQGFLPILELTWFAQPFTMLLVELAVKM